ncbi:MAG TPA: radical SAM protein [Longimicrobium sp.]|nr:radical SAM protein [Longimicrobium sp.]
MILLAHSYFLALDPKQSERMKPYSPLATLLTAALLRERGHPVAFFDAMVAPGVEAFLETLERTNPDIVCIQEDNFNFLTKMCTVRMREAAIEMIDAAHARGCKVAVNGSDAADRPALYLAAGADAVVIGEGEEAILELVEAWRADRDASLDGIQGLVLPEKAGAVRRTAPRSAEEDLDGLPFPAWDLVDPEAYRRAWTDAHGRFSWNMVTSRGCPYKCNWCAKPVFGRRYTQRSPAGVAEEMRRLKERIGPDHVWFADDIFGLTAEWIAEFAAEVTRRNARTPFMMQSRVNLMRPKVVAALKEAGAEEVWLGVESGSQKILDAMDKGSTVQAARDATRALQAAGIRACWFIQLGYPSELWEDVLMTRDLIREERPDDIGVSVAYPLPGTIFHQKVQAQLGARRNWQDTGELAMLFHGTYTTEFYRKLRNALHDEARTGVPDEVRWAALEREEVEHRSPEPLTLAGD